MNEARENMHANVHMKKKDLNVFNWYISRNQKTAHYKSIKLCREESLVALIIYLLEKVRTIKIAS